MDWLQEELLTSLGADAAPPDVHRLYTSAQLTDLLAVPRSRVRAWMLAGLIQPVEEIQGVCYFDFRQVAGAKTLCDLTSAGISIAKIRRSLEQLKVWRADAEQPLDQLALLEKNGQILVRLEKGLVEPSGQLCFDFGDEHANIPMQPTTAEQWFQIGCQHEEDGQFAAAIDAYRQALLLAGPDAVACFNLANVLFATDQLAAAAERYRQAVEIDPSRAEAWNNLGVVLGRMSRVDEAVAAFAKAIDLSYADAHYNLADLLEKQGRSSEAQEHWQAYVRCDPKGPWSDHARGMLR